MSGRERHASRAIQCPLGGDARGERRARRAARARGGGARARRSSCRRSSSRGRTSAARRSAEWFAEARAVEDDEAVARLRERRARARRRHPGLVLRARRAGLLQQRRHRRRRRRACSASTARATSPTARATRRSSTSARATPASACGRRGTATLGVGICWDQWFPESRARDDAPRRRGAPLPDGHRQRAARARPRHARPVAARDDRARRVERRPGRRGEPHRRRGAGSASTARRSSPTRAATRSPSWGAADEGVIVAHASTSTRIARTRAAWGFFRDRRPELYGVLTTADGSARQLTLREIFRSRTRRSLRMSGKVMPAQATRD